MASSAGVHNRPATLTGGAADRTTRASAAQAPQRAVIHHSPAAPNAAAPARGIPRQRDGDWADRHGLDRGLAVDPRVRPAGDPDDPGTCQGGSATAVTASLSSAPDLSALDEYGHLVAVQCRYARLAPDDPQRTSLREQLISGYLPVAEHIARRFAGRGEPLEDLVQVAIVGLINAIDRFDPDRGCHFLAFAVPTITGEIRRYFRDHGWSTRVPRRLKDLYIALRKTQEQLSQQHRRAPRPSDLADHLGLSTLEVIHALHAGEAYSCSSLDELLAGESTTTRLGDYSAPTTLVKHIGRVDTDLALIDHRETLRPLLAELTPRDRTILALRFFHGLTQTQIAEQVGISQMHVSRILRKTLTFLHQGMIDDNRSPDLAPADDAAG